MYIETEPTLKNKNSLSAVVIKPSKGLVFFSLREIWEYRGLLYFLTWRDIKIHYKQTVLGITWAVIKPLFTMVIFSVIFGQLAKLPSDGIPYPVFTYAALLPWQLFSSALTRISSSLTGNANLLTKVYFPRLIIPLSALVTGVLDFIISFIILLGLMFYYGITPTPFVFVWLPIFVFLTLLAALSVGLWFSALNVRYRDVQHMMPFLLQAWMYASPVAYSISLIPGNFWRVGYDLNPLVGIIQGFRWTLLGANAPDKSIIVSTAIVLVLLVAGLFYFSKTEKTFADAV
jgi:lipopolysaccharide transport system permease protein